MDALVVNQIGVKRGAANFDGALDVDSFPSLFSSIFEGIVADAVKSAETGAPLKRDAIDSFFAELTDSNRPLNHTYLAEDKFYLIGDALKRAGFAEGDTMAFLKELADGCTDKRISISGIIKEVENFYQEKSRRFKSGSMLDAGMIPHLESLFRRAGIDPKSIENALEASRTQDGRIDLIRFVRRLFNIPEGKALLSAGQGSDKEAFREIADRILQNSVTLSVGQGQRDARIRMAELKISREAKKVDLFDPAQGQAPLKKGAGGSELKSMIQELLGRTANNGDSNPFPLLKARKQGGEVLNALEGMRQEGQKLSSGKTGLADAMANAATAAKGNSSFAAEAQNPVPRYVLRQVGQQLIKPILLGRNEFDLKLRPPELGALSIHLSMNDNRLSLRILAENPETGKILAHGAYELKQMLANQGIRMESLNVEIQHDFSRFVDTSGSGHQERSGGGLGEEKGRDTAQAKEGVPKEARQVRSLARLLDLRV